MMEEVSGGRMHYMFNRVGGLKEDLPAGWLGRVAARRRRRCAAGCPTLENLIVGNEIFQARTRGVGVLDAEHGRGVRRLAARSRGPPASTSTCAATSPTSPTASCSPTAALAGWSPGPRATASPGSRCCSSRSTSRSTSPTPASTGCAQLPPGPINVRLPKVLKAPEGATYAWTENPLGINGYYLVSRGEKTPWRLKLRSASFNNVAGARRAAAGQPDRRHGRDPRLDVLRRRRHRQVGGVRRPRRG